jgi:hypothetical protein
MDLIASVIILAEPRLRFSLRMTRGYLLLLILETGQ